MSVIGATMSSAWRWLVRTVDRGDVVALVGVAFVGAGLWQVSPAAGLAVPGAVLVWVALPPRPPFVDKR